MFSWPSASLLWCVAVCCMSLSPAATQYGSFPWTPVSSFGALALHLCLQLVVAETHSGRWALASGSLKISGLILQPMLVPNAAAHYSSALRPSATALSEWSQAAPVVMKYFWCVSLIGSHAAGGRRHQRRREELLESSWRPLNRS